MTEDVRSRPAGSARSRLGRAAAAILLFAAGCGGSHAAAGGGPGNDAGSSGSSASSGGASSGDPTGGSSSSGGSGGSSGSSGASGDGAATAFSGPPQSVLQRGNDVYRSASFVEPGLTATSVATMAPDATFDENATFPANGNTQNQGTASVLFLDDGPPAAGCPSGAAGCLATARAAHAGLFFAFPALGSNPNVVAFDEASGLTVWTAHLSTGGDGVRGTPVIDLAARRLYVVTGNDPHLVHALSVDTGAEVTSGGWPVTLSSATVSHGAQTFDSGAENQHGALLLVNGILYVPFGGPYGDGGDYLGWIVAVDTTNPARLGAWATQSPRSGIWGSGGLASDGTYVFAVTGDTTSVPRSASDSEEVLRVQGLAQFSRDEASLFVPTEWQAWDKPMGDLDFGASTPAYVPLPAGSKPAAFLVAPAKAGRLFVLDGTDLSTGSYPSPGGELADLVIASTTAESIYTAPTVYRSASGLHTAVNVGVGPANCPAPAPKSKGMIISVLLSPGQTPIATESWCAPSAGADHLNYPPISTTSDGAGHDALVWYVNGSQLTAVDGDTGRNVVTTSGAACNGVPGMSFPIAVKNRVVVSALGHLCSWSVH